jgi:hypothetical protein
MDAIYWANCGYKLIVVVVVGLKAVSNTLLCPAIYHVKQNTVSTLSFKVVPYTSGKIWSARYDVCMQISSISVIKTTERKSAMWLVNL